MQGMTHEQLIRAIFRQYMGDIDLEGLELLRLIKMVANLYDALGSERLRAAELSGPRLRLLMRLWAEEEQGHRQGIPPTHLSRWQNVSKNTISALLRGLEEQGLVERTLDREDRRVFRIRLSDAGRQLVQTTAPQHMVHLNEIASALSPTERAELIRLLGKLHQSLAAHASPGQCETGEETRPEEALLGEKPGGD